MGSASAVELVAWKVRGLFGVRVAALLLPPASDADDCHGRNAPIHARGSKNARYQVPTHPGEILHIARKILRKELFFIQ